MTRLKTTLTLILSLIQLLSSCSVKEDRSPCPCWLTIDLYGCGGVSNTVAVTAWNGRTLFSEEVPVSQDARFLERTVPKGMIRSSVVSGFKRKNMKDGEIIIPEGNQAEEIWGHGSIVDCSGEFARDSAVMGRQFAKVYLKTEMPEGKEYPYELEVRSDVQGMKASSLEPVPGEFRYRLSLDKDNCCVFRLPRQRDDSKAIIAVRENDGIVENLPLYEWIRETGYDWHAKDLKEIYIGMDYARANVSIRVQGWQEGDSVNIII